MKIHSFKVALTAAAAVMACLLLAAPTAMAAEGAYKLDGAVTRE